ncbi:hypothetical protein PSPO01_01775 [Paraphaeosphaeria sporulosa]
MVKDGETAGDLQVQERLASLLGDQTLEQSRPGKVAARTMADTPCRFELAADLSALSSLVDRLLRRALVAAVGAGIAQQAPDSAMHPAPLPVVVAAGGCLLRPPSQCIVWLQPTEISILQSGGGGQSSPVVTNGRPHCSLEIAFAPNPAAPREIILPHRQTQVCGHNL